MKCDQRNEEELKRLKEQAHPMGESKDPDLVEDPGMSAGHRANRKREAAERRST